MKNPCWRKLSSQMVHKNPWFSVHKDKIMRPGGSHGIYYILKKDPGVMIIPFDGQKIYLISQFRYTFKKRMWELPAGKSESGNYLQEAKKELKEETGLVASKWTYLGRFACGPGHTDHIGKAYLAQELRQEESNPEFSELDIIVQAFSLKEIDKMILSGKIIDSWTITTLYFFKQYLNKKKRL